MSLITPARRLTVYAGRHVDATEATVLAGSGLVHADQFKVATTDKLAGWKPYLHDVKIKRGALDLLEAKTTVPQCTFTIRDQRLTEGGSNLLRWWTGLMGAAGGKGRFQQSGCKVVVEEADDWDEEAGTGTWEVTFTGRISQASLKGLLARCTAQGMTKELVRAPIFTQRPHSSIAYVAEPLLLPVGFTGTYGNLVAAPIYRGTIGNASKGAGKSIYLDNASLHDPYNVVTSGLATSFASGTEWMRTVMVGGKWPRVRLKSGGTIGDFGVNGFRTHSRDDQPHHRVTEIHLTPLGVTEENYLAVPADGTVWELSILRPKVPPSPSTPVMINNVRGPQLLSDMLDGKFGPLNDDGTVPVGRSWAKDGANFAAFIADTSYPLLRFPVTASDKLLAWGQTKISKVSRIALAENTLGQLKLLDLRLPTSLAGIPTLTDADLVATEAPEWEHNADDAIQWLEAHSYIEDLIFAEDLAKLPGAIPDLPSGLIRSTTVVDIEPDFSAGGGGRTEKIDAIGFRSTQAEVSAAAATHQLDRVAGDVKKMMNELRMPFAAGPQRITLSCRRNTTTKALQPGSWTLVQVSKLPDPQTNQRGGTRLMRVIDKSEEKGQFDFSLLDAGPNSICAVPVIGVLGSGTDAAHEVTIPITVNADADPIVVRVAITDQSVGVIPADSSPLWTVYGGPYPTSQTVTATSGVPGKRMWVQIRSEPNQANRKACLPSAWVTAATAYRNLTALTAFTSVAISNVTSKAATVTINLGGNTKDYVRILIASAASQAAADAATPVRLVDLLPGTTTFQLSGLDAAGANWWHRVQAQPYDGIVGVGTPAGSTPTSFQATGTPVKWPKVAGVLPLGGTTIISAVKGFDRQNQMVRTGNGFILIPGQLGLDIKIQRAPNAGGSPGAWADYQRIYASQIVKEGTAWSDLLPLGTPYWYRFAQSGEGGDDSDWTEGYLAMPGILANDSLMAKAPGPLPRERPMAGGARSVLQLQTWIWPNSEFDLWESDGLTPAGWAVDLTGGAVVSRVSAPHSGDYALRYKNPDNATNGGWHGLSTLDPVKGAFCMPFRPATKYRLLIASKASVVANGQRFRVTLDFGAGGTFTKELVYQDLGHAAGSYGALFEIPITVPANAGPNTKGTIEFSRNANGSDCEFDLDSIRADEETADYEILSQQIQDQGYAVSVNGDFERGRAYWEEYRAAGGAAVLSIETSTVDKGTKALKIDVTVNGTQTLIWQSRRTTDEHVIVTDAGTVLATRVREGDIVQVRGSVRLSAAGPTARLGVRVWSGGGLPSGAGSAVIVGATNVSGSYQPLNGFYVVPAGVQWVAAYIQIDSQNAGTTVLIDDLVVARVLRLPTVKVYNPTGTDVVLPNNSNTPIPFSTELWDEGGFHSTVSQTTRLSIPNVGGVYDGIIELFGQVTFEQDSGGYRRIRIQKNGTIILGTVHDGPVADEMSLQIYAVDRNPAPGDYYELFAFQTSGGNLNVVGGHDAAPNPDIPTKTFFGLHYRR